MKNKLFKTIIISTFLNFLLISNVFSNDFSQTKEYKSYTELRQKLDNLIYNHPQMKKTFIGIKVKDLTINKDIYYMNQNNLFVPASNTKIFTTLLSLEKLGKDFYFETLLAKENNDLLLLFSGDPTLTNNDLKELLNNYFQKNDIKSFDGNIILNVSAFDDTYYGPGWMWDDFKDCYSTVITANTLDENCINIKVGTSEKLEPEFSTNNDININSDNLRVVKSNINDVKIESIDEYFNLKLSGNLGLGTQKNLEFSIHNINEYIIHSIKNYFRENNINFTGSILINDYPVKDDIKIISSHKSILVKDILKKFNKDSHNLTGELLLKKIGEINLEKPGSTSKGIEVLKDYIQKTFFQDRFRIVDGSGLSRYNMVTPSLILNVLEYMYDNHEYRKIIFNSFPIGGEEGTLKNRLKETKNYKVIAKSGSMTGVNNISGYLVKDKSNVIGFSIMINNAYMSGKELRDFQDQIIYELSELLN